MREESGEATSKVRIDLERVIVDPDYRRRVLARLVAETHSDAPLRATVPQPEN